MSIRDEAVGAGATAILSRPIDAAGSVAGEAEPLTAVRSGVIYQAEGES